MAVETAEEGRMEEEVFGATTLTLTTLIAITDYTFSVAAATGAGTGPFTGEARITTPEGGRYCNQLTVVAAR